MAGHHDPKLLYAIKGISAYHIQDGEEHPLTPSGPQTLSLLMVPTDSRMAELGTARPGSEAPVEDFYLHLNLPPEVELPLPATTQIYHQPPCSYLIPRWDMGPDSHAFTKIEFPPIGYGVTQEDVDTFETILAQCTAFLERAKPPLPSRPGGEKSGYNPADYATGGKYASDRKGAEVGQIVLVDEDDGSVVGELGGEAKIFQDSRLKPGSKDPVEVEMSADGKRITVQPVSEEYLRMARHPAYAKSSVVQQAATASRLIVTTSSQIGNWLTSGAESFTQKTKPNPKPMEFSPAAHANVRRINTMTEGAASVSSKTVGMVTDITQNVAASMTGHKRRRPAKGQQLDEQGRPREDVEDYYGKPGLLNKSMIAFSTVMDGIATGGKHLMNTSGAAASTVVGHRYGDQAGGLTSQLAGGVKNVGLVYIDVTGVSRRAVIKSVAKGMVVGKVRGGGDVVVGGGDGGGWPPQDTKKSNDDAKSTATTGASSLRPIEAPPAGPSYGPTGGEYRPVGFGNAGGHDDGAPPNYQEFGQREKYM